jgi:hypothetical protein
MKCLCARTTPSAGEEAIGHLKKTLKQIRFHKTDPRELCRCLECGQY